jgi:hypothetical protein
MIFKQAALKRAITSVGLNPRQRSKYAQTASQEIGWICTPLYPKNDLQENGLKSSPITGYMENFVRSKGKNPFCKDIFYSR